MSREKILCGNDEIFRVANSIVDRDGVEALSIRAIAKELGVAPMTIYNYVEGLQEIKKRVLINGFDRMYSTVYASLNKLAVPVSAFTYCHSIALSIFRFAISNKEMYTYMFSEGQRLFKDDGEIRPFYNQISKLTKRAKATQKIWEKNEQAFRLLERIVFSVSYQVSAGAQFLTEEDYAKMIDFYLQKCITE